MSEVENIEHVSPAPLQKPQEMDEQDYDMAAIDNIEDILALEEDQYPTFSLAKNKARFSRILTDYKSKHKWLDVGQPSGVKKLLREQRKELESLRYDKMEHECQLASDTLTPSQYSCCRDEMKMCAVRIKMAVQVVTKATKVIKEKEGH